MQRKKIEDSESQDLCDDKESTKPSDIESFCSEQE